MGGRLWDDDGAALLAALHLPRRTAETAAVAAHVRAMEEPSAVKAGEQHESPGKPVPPGGKDTRDPTAGASEAPAPASSRPPPVDPHGLPGPRLDEFGYAAAAALRAEAVRVLEVAVPRDRATPTLAMVVLGWPPSGHTCRSRVGGPHAGAPGQPSCRPGSNVPTTWPGTPATVSGRRR